MCACIVPLTKISQEILMTNMMGHIMIAAQLSIWFVHGKSEWHWSSTESIFLVGKSCTFLISLDTVFIGAVLRTFDSVVDHILLEVYKLGTIGNMIGCSKFSMHVWNKLAQHLDNVGITKDTYSTQQQDTGVSLLC